MKTPTKTEPAKLIFDRITWFLSGASGTAEEAMMNEDSLANAPQPTTLKWGGGGGHRGLVLRDLEPLPAPRCCEDLQLLLPFSAALSSPLITSCMSVRPSWSTFCTRKRRSPGR